MSSLTFNHFHANKVVIKMTLKHVELAADVLESRSRKLNFFQTIKKRESSEQLSVDLAR